MAEETEVQRGWAACSGSTAKWEVQHASQTTAFCPRLHPKAGRVAQVTRLASSSGDTAPAPAPGGAAPPAPPPDSARAALLREAARCGREAVLRPGRERGGVTPLQKKETCATSSGAALASLVRWGPCRGPWSYSTMCCPPTPGWASRWRRGWGAEGRGKGERRKQGPWSPAIPGAA